MLPEGRDNRVSMRINLVTPFAEKDAAKALGARWDSAKKQWYIVDVADLTPFMRWIPDLASAGSDDASTAPSNSANPARTNAARSAGKGVITKSSVVFADCGCKVLPWEACSHSRSLQTP